MPCTRLCLGKWYTVRKDLLPLLLSQSKNRKLIYGVLTILVHLTNPLDDFVNREDFDDLKGYLEGYKEQLSLEEFSDLLVVLLGDVVKAEVKTKYHLNMIEVAWPDQLIMTLVRNILQIEVSSSNIMESYKDNLQIKLYSNFGKRGGMFDALIFLCQDMQTDINKKLRLVYLEIFYAILSSFPASFLFGTTSEEEYFKSLREKERIKKMNRSAMLSTRHSRFGAMIEVKRNIGKTSAITSNVNFDINALNKLDFQRAKPKVSKRYASTRDTKIKGNQIVRENHGVLNEQERAIQMMLKHFVADFLEHAYESLIDSVYDLLSKDTQITTDTDFLHYFMVMAMGIECYCLEFERTNGSSTSSNSYSRPVIEEKMACKFSYVIHGVQVTLIDMLFRKMAGEAVKKKAEFKTKFFHSCLHYFNQILTATLILSNSSAANDQKNSNLLKQVIFSKDFSRVLKIGFEYYEPKLHSISYAESLVKVQDSFFTLLSNHAKDKILLAKTDKLQRVKTKLPKRAQTAMREEKAEEDAEVVEEDDLEHDFEEEDEDEGNYTFKERKYNFYSEFTNFVSSW